MNPTIDYHIVYATLTLWLVVANAGRVYGLDGWIALHRPFRRGAATAYRCQRALSIARRDHDTNNPMVVSGHSLVPSAPVYRQQYENVAHLNYGATEYSADLAQCRHRIATTVVSTLGYNVQSGVGVDEVKTNACMATQGWQQAHPRLLG